MLSSRLSPVIELPGHLALAYQAELIRVLIYQALV